MWRRRRGVELFFFQGDLGVWCLLGLLDCLVDCGGVSFARATVGLKTNKNKGV